MQEDVTVSPLGITPMMSYEDKIAKVLKVYGDVEQAWRSGEISVFTLNDLSDILDEYTDMVEERM